MKLMMGCQRVRRLVARRQVQHWVPKGQKVLRGVRKVPGPEGPEDTAPGPEDEVPTGTDALGVPDTDPRNACAAESA